MKIQFLCGLLIATCLCPPLTAQEELTERQKAILCFDIRVDELMETEVLKAVGNEQLSRAAEEGMLPVAPQNFKRIFGLVGAPESVEQMERLSPNGEPLPMQFMVEYEFADESSADAMMGELGLVLDKPIESNGVNYYSPPQEFAPQNIVGGKKSPTTVTFGTKAFVFNQRPKSLFSSELLKVWSAQNDAPIRLSIDGKTRADILAQIVEVASAEAGPEAAPMIQLIDNIESLNLMVDPDANEMIALRAIGIDEANAEELRGTLNGLLGMAKLLGGGMIQELTAEAPNAAGAASSILGDLNTTGTGHEVNITINKPDGFAEALAEMQTVMSRKAKSMSRMNDMRQVVLGMHNYESAFGKLPFDASTRRHEDLSWRVVLLPFIEQTNIFDSLDMAKGPGDEPNSAFAGQMPALFGADGENSTIMFVQSDVKRFGDIRDGTSNTIVMIEYPGGSPWLENKNLTADEVVAMFAELEEGQSLMAAMYDGSVHRIEQGIDEQVLRNLLDPKDGNVIEDWNQ